MASSTLDLGLPCDVNIAAGCNLLAKYEDDWKDIHENNLENSKKAQEIAKQIQTIEKRMTNHHVVMTDLIHCLSAIPSLILKLKSCQETLDEVHNLGNIVDEELEKLEDLCDECELQEYILEKQCEISKYKQKKMGKWLCITRPFNNNSVLLVAIRILLEAAFNICNIFSLIFNRGLGNLSPKNSCRTSAAY